MSDRLTPNVSAPGSLPRMRLPRPGKEKKSASGVLTFEQRMAAFKQRIKQSVYTFTHWPAPDSSIETRSNTQAKRTTVGRIHHSGLCKVPSPITALHGAYIHPLGGDMFPHRLKGCDWLSGDLRIYTDLDRLSNSCFSPHCTLPARYQNPPLPTAQPLDTAPPWDWPVR